MRKNKLRLSLLIVSFLIAEIHFAFGQSELLTIRAKIIDSKSNNSIPFVTVKFIGKNGITGVVTNSDGDFLIPTYYKAIIDSVIISCIGYQNKKFLADALQENELNIIKLNESITSLSEVVVKGTQRFHFTTRGK